MSESPPVTPLLNWLLAAAASLPFLGSAFLLAFGPAQMAGPALLWLTTYGVVTLSLIGGHRWGLEVASRGNAFLLLAAGAPAVIGWSILILPPSLITGFRGLVVLLILHALTLAWDLLGGALPRWYKPLRAAMGAAGLVSLGLGAWKAATLGA